MRITALIPAHNEAESIVDTVHSLQMQTLPPTTILVIADNCTDDTVSLARDAGAEVYETMGNVDKKAGALNQVLDLLLPDLGSDDFVLVMDADTALGPEFLSTATSRLQDDATLGACGGSFYAKNEDTLVQVVQGNEYARYVREICRRKGARANVLTGAGSLFRASVLSEVAAARDAGTIPGTGVYKQDALTEDNELTLAVKTLGYSVVSPLACSIYTDAPSTTKELYAQRLRWRRGALEDLKSYGLTKTTAPYFGKMIWSVVVSILSFIYLVLVFRLYTGGASFIFSPFWTGVFVVYVADRWWTIRHRSGRAQMAALILPIEIAYDLFQQAVLGRALWDFAFRTEQRWVHTTPVKEVN
jgi:poly-beta-1,6-N-acetyl-D-glucosamine synthase